MIIPIRCFSCGKPVGHLWEEFEAKVAAGENKKKVLDENGMVIPQASLEVFKQQMEQLVPLFIQDINKKKNHSI